MLTFYPEMAPTITPTPMEALTTTMVKAAQPTRLPVATLTRPTLARNKSEDGNWLL